MKEFRHILDNEKKQFSITIIPSTTNKYIQFNIPYWLPIITILFVTILSATSMYYFQSFRFSYNELQAALNRILVLNTENSAQAEEIAYLRDRSAEIEANLKELYNLQNIVLSMVGLEEGVIQKPQMDKSNDEIDMISSMLLVSRSGDRNNYFGEREDDLHLLEHLIERQKENMQKLIVDVEKQLEYIDALPNLMPTTGKISSGFGSRISPITRRREFHNGIDIANRSNTDIIAAGSGIVTFSGYNGTYGRMIMVSHGHGYISIYAHNSRNLVKVGDYVRKGDVIAKMGNTGRSTGPHLHFEVRLNGKPIDPKTILNN